MVCTKYVASTTRRGDITRAGTNAVETSKQLDADRKASEAIPVAKRVVLNANGLTLITRGVAMVQMTAEKGMIRGCDILPHPVTAEFGRCAAMFTRYLPAAFGSPMSLESSLGAHS